MSHLTPAWTHRRRAKIEEAYERLIVKAARECVDETTTTAQRARAQESLMTLCAAYSEFHSLSASRLFLGAVRKAREEKAHANPKLEGFE